MPRPPGTPDPDLWVLRLPPGTQCSVGYSANEIIERNGSVRPNRQNEDRYFTCNFQDKVQLFMVLDGHDGPRACDFAQKHIPSVMLRSALEGGEEVTRRAFHSAFMDTEKQFFLSINPHITRKITLQIEIDQKARNSAEALTMFLEQVEEMQRLESQISGGTTAVIALIYNSWLQVANVGDSRAVLCYLDGSRRLCTEQLSVDHNTNNEDELHRLKLLGLDPDYLRSNGRLGVHQNTRSIGDHSMKGGYKDIDIIRHATREPGTAEPFIGKSLDTRSITGFLILMTDGLYDAFQSWSGRPLMVNQDLAHLIAQEMGQCHDITHVAQNVVEKVKQVYKGSCLQRLSSGRIDDITLIIRNFGYPIGVKRRPSEPAAPLTMYHPLLHPTPSVPSELVNVPRLQVSAATNIPPSYPTAPITTHTGLYIPGNAGSPFFSRSIYNRQDGIPGSPGQGFSTLQPAQIRRSASDDELRRAGHQPEGPLLNTSQDWSSTLPQRQQPSTAGVGMYNPQQFYSGIDPRVSHQHWTQASSSQTQHHQPPYYQQSSQGGPSGTTSGLNTHVPVTSSPVHSHLPQTNVTSTASTPPSHRRPASAHVPSYENVAAGNSLAASLAQDITSQKRVDYENIQPRVLGSTPKRYSDSQLPEKIERMGLEGISPIRQESFTPPPLDSEATPPVQPPSTLPITTPPGEQHRPVPVPRKRIKGRLVQVQLNLPENNASDKWMYIDDSLTTPTNTAMPGVHQMEETHDSTTPIQEDQHGTLREQEAEDFPRKEEDDKTESDDEGVLEVPADILYNINRSMIHSEANDEDASNILTTPTLPLNPPVPNFSDEWMYTDSNLDNRDNFNLALKLGQVKCSAVTCAITGAGGVGKSTTICNLLDEDPRSDGERESTGLAEKPVRAISTTIAVSSAESDVSVHWSRLDICQIIADHAKAAIEGYCISESFSNNVSDTEMKLEDTPDIPEDEKTYESNMPASTDSQPSIPLAIMKQDQAQLNEMLDDIAKLKCMATGSIMKLEEFNEMLDDLAKLMDTATGSTLCVHLKLIYLLDSGGQERFHDLLRIFLPNLSANIFVLKLSEALTDHPITSRYVGGKLCGHPYRCPFSHEQILKQSVRALQMSKRSANKEDSPRIAVIGTHKDLEHLCPETKDEKNKKLIDMLQHSFGENLIFSSGVNELIFAINAKQPGSDDKKVISDVRKSILDNCSLKPKVIPLPWFVLEEMLQKYAQFKGSFVLSTIECREIANRLHVDGTAFEDALMYLASLNILFYYPDVLPRVVFCTSQVVLDKVNELVWLSYELHDDRFVAPEPTNKQVGLSGKKWLPFRNRGLLTEELLLEARFSKHYIHDLFMPADLLKLWQKLRVVARLPLSTTEFFMPCLLEELSAEEVDKRRSGSSSCALPLLIHFPDGWPPSGIFCELATLLISKPGWNIIVDDSDLRPYHNCIEFDLHGMPGTVTLIDSFHLGCFEVHLHIDECVVKPTEIGMEFCPEIQNVVLSCLRKCVDDNTQPEVAFFCTHSYTETDFKICYQSQLHHASLIHSKPYLKCCQRRRHSMKLTPQHFIWLQSWDDTATSSAIVHTKAAHTTLTRIPITDDSDTLAHMASASKILMGKIL